MSDGTWTAEGALPDDFDRIYTEGGYLFFKDDITRGLDEAIGDVDSNIKDEEGTFCLDCLIYRDCCRQFRMSHVDALAPLSKHSLSRN
jgi:hypothetical protein